MMDAKTPKLDISGSRLFVSWLASCNASLAFTTYQAGKLFMIGLKPDQSLSVFERTFDRCMGLGMGQGQFWMSSLYQMWRFENFLDQGTTPDGYDALYVPLAGHTTGDVDVHDIHVCADGSPLFVVTRFNCIARLAEKGSFTPVWHPPFIDRIAAEDRCHLNGMAVENDRPRYVTCVGASNVSDGWRDHRTSGGLVIDVDSNETIVSGLSMPHSPRLYRDTLYMLQSGTGEFGKINLDEGTFEPICFLPGFARGLSFIGNYAVIGLSQPRDGRTFNGLALNERLEAEGATAKCALCIVNLETGDVEHRLDIEGLVHELYDVAVVPGVQRPKMLGFRNDEIRFAARIVDEEETGGPRH